MGLPIVLAMTGASGAAYSLRLLQVLLAAGRDVHLTISPSAVLVYRQELGLTLDLEALDARALLAACESQAPLAMPSASDRRGALTYHHYANFLTPIASGSFLTAGMVICPCSGGTLGAVVHCTGSNLVHRAAEVHLKERRKLVLVPRETPLSLVQLDNMKRACEAGAVVLPAAPGWYHGVRSVQDLVDFVVARILDQLGVEHSLMHRWGEPVD